MTSRSFSPPALPAPGLAARAAPGLLLAAGVALAAIAAAHLPWFATHGIGSLTLAIAFGILAGNLVPLASAPAADEGLALAKQHLLRWGIVLYGLRLTFQDVGRVGVAGIVIDATVLLGTFGLATVLGRRLFGLDRETAMLIGAGSSICGAAAVLATAPVVRGRPAQVAVAVSTVVLFGTLAIFLYPALYRAFGPALGVDAHAYGVWAGSTIHEVAQVVAAGRAVDGAAGDTAVIAKMVRVMMLAPFLVGLSAWLARGARTAGAQAAPIAVPWFAFGFIAMTGIGSLHVLPEAALADAATVATAALTVAMAALGLTTRAAAMRAAGLKPLALGALLFVWLVVGGAAINLLVTHWATTPAA